MKIAELKEEMGLPKAYGGGSRRGPSVLLSARFTLSKPQAVALLEKIEIDDIRLPDLFRRLIQYYIADHDGYKIR